jgi:hypothetical protein
MSNADSIKRAGCFQFARSLFVPSGREEIGRWLLNPTRLVPELAPTLTSRVKPFPGLAPQILSAETIMSLFRATAQCRDLACNFPNALRGIAKFCTTMRLQKTLKSRIFSRPCVEFTHRLCRENDHWEEAEGLRMRELRFDGHSQNGGPQATSSFPPF